MLTIPVDEGYGYDFLAILQVKHEKGVLDKATFDHCSNHLREQIGPGGHKIILESPEYAECVRVNAVTFDKVEDAREDRVPASVVWNRNDDRYVAKLRLQKRFFPDSLVTEKKSFTKSIFK